MLKTCKLVPWYRFKKCCVRTCKHWSKIAPCRCLELDRVVDPGASRAYTDAEIGLFKNFGVDVKSVGRMRKAAQLDVRRMLVLWKFIEYISTNFQSSEVVVSDVQDVAEAAKLMTPELQFKQWMWPYLVSAKVWQSFTSRASGECAGMTLEEVLDVDGARLNALKTKLGVLI